VETFGTDSEPVLTVASRHQELECQLNEAGRLAALLQAEMDDRERCRGQLDSDVQLLVDWLSGVVEELNRLSVSQPSESDDELLRRYAAVRVMINLFLHLYILAGWPLRIPLRPRGPADISQKTDPSSLPVPVPV